MAFGQEWVPREAGASSPVVVLRKERGFAFNVGLYIMPEKIHRLSKNQDFTNVLKKGSGFSSQFLAVRFIGNKFGFSRFGFLASGKIFKKAVTRNAIRRKLKEALRPYLSVVVSGIDLILIAKKGIESRNFQELKEIVFFIIKRAGILSR